MSSDRQFFLDHVPLDEARQRLEQTLSAAGRWGALPGETVPLTEALGRVTAGPIWAKLSSPYYHAAAMDGYAVDAAATLGAMESRPLRLRVQAQAFAVDTGDPLPADTNAVIMIEDVQTVGTDHIEIRSAVAPWQHVRPMGEDMVATELVLPTNHRLRPVDLGAIAGCGHASVTVRRRPRVVIIPTGHELIAPGTPPQAGQIIEFNSLVLAAQIREAGGQADVLPIVPDDAAQLRAALDSALERQPDMVLMLSGSSAGSEDYSASVIRERGALLVHGVAVRPGHPVILGMVADTPVIGVPGYPVSAALTGELFVLPLVAHWLGLPSPFEQKPRLKAVLTRKLLSPVGDDDYVRLALAKVGNRTLATPLSRGAGVITSLVRADGLLHIPRFSEGADMGREVEALLYSSPPTIEQTVLIVGSHDPMLDLLAQAVAEFRPGWRLVSAHVGSMGGLMALRRDEAHLAGIHLLDPERGEFNVSYVQKYLPGVALQLVTFAHREQGLIVAPGNPLHIRSIDDLPRCRYVNRQRGAGTRVLLDYELSRRGIQPEQISGYEREEYTHLAVASAVASGTADTGLGLRSGALALGLDFIPVSWERYDLVIPDAYRRHEGVQAVLALLNEGDFRQQLAAQPGYDTRETGRVQWTQVDSEK